MTLTVKYLKHLELEGKAEATIDTYKYHLIEFLVWISDQNMKVFDVKSTHLVHFKEHLLKAGKSERTVNCIISCVRGYCDYLVLNQIIEVNTVSNILSIKVPSYRQNRLTDEELNHLSYLLELHQLVRQVRRAFWGMSMSDKKGPQQSKLPGS